MNGLHSTCFSFIGSEAIKLFTALDLLPQKQNSLIMKHKHYKIKHRRVCTKICTKNANNKSLVLIWKMASFCKLSNNFFSLIEIRPG